MQKQIQDDNRLRLNELERRLEFMERLNHLGYWELDFSRQLMYWSPEMYQIFGLPQSYKIKRNFIREQLYREDIEIYKNSLRRLLIQDQPVEVILRIRRLDGKLLHCQFRAHKREQNQKLLIAGTLQNVDSLIQIQCELNKAKEYAEQLNQEKSYFYAQISHDLRQPLQALKIFIALLREENLSREQISLVEKIENSVSNLEQWLDNLLETAKLESGGLKYQETMFDISEFLQKVSDEYYEIAKYKGINFISTGKEILIKTDAVLLERVVRNLLNNAFKYTYNSVKLRWYAIKHKLRIIVQDNGAGLDNQARQNIFCAYYQQPKHRHLGSGLGLAIVRELTKILHADICLYSKPHKGTIFRLTLPLR